MPLSFFSYSTKCCVKSSWREGRGSPYTCSFLFSRTGYLRLWLRILFFYISNILTYQRMFENYSYDFLFPFCAEHILIYCILSCLWIPQPFYLHTDPPSTQSWGELWCIFNCYSDASRWQLNHTDVKPELKSLVNTQLIGHDEYMYHGPVWVYGPINFFPRNSSFDFRELIPSLV